MQQFKDRFGNELQIGDKVKYISYNTLYNEPKRYNAIIESFTDKNTKISFIGSNKTQYTKPEIYLEKITKETIEEIQLNRDSIDAIVNLLEFHSIEDERYGKIASYLRRKLW